MEEDIIMKAEVLIEAFPYIQQYQGKYFVMKVGGSIFRKQEAKVSILQDIAFLKLIGIKSILVCGGGPFITEEIEKRGKKVEFVDGLRITDKEVIEIVKDVLSGVRDELVDYLNNELKVGASSIQPEENCLSAKKIHYQTGEEVVDLGFVGQVDKVNTERFKEKSMENDILVLAPLAYSDEGVLYNINGDTVASSIATALGAEKLIYLTNVLGVMRNPEKSDTLISVLEVSQVESLRKQKVIKSGMIPKVKAATDAIKKGVNKVHIISGNIPHSILLEIFTDQGIGTEIVLKTIKNG